MKSKKAKPVQLGFYSELHDPAAWIDDVTRAATISAQTLPTDPLLSQQWHLDNPIAGLFDLNVVGVWAPDGGLAYTGAGTRTVVIDDGFDYTHSDLAPNYSTALDYDYYGGDADPFGLDGDSHGTAVAGIIGADNDGSGTVGIAFNTSLVGYRVGFLSNIDDAVRDAALSAAAGVVNISLGLSGGIASAFVDFADVNAIETSNGTAVDNGRGGLGTVIVKSAANNRGIDFDVNADDWTNDTRQVVVAAVDQDGYVSYYSSYGAAILVSAFGTPGEVLTTDRTGAGGYSTGNFTYGFNGTSSAAPMVAGVVALMLEANASLGWRDVQSILASSARHVGSDHGAGLSGSERYDWGWNASSTWNGGGMHFSNDYGYGLVDALAAVRLAETWLVTGTTAATTLNEATNTVDVLNASTVIPDGNSTGLTFSGTATFDDIVDRVTVSMTFSTTYTGDMKVYLTSPDGTVSLLIDRTGGGNDYNGTWTFESQAFRGERAQGSWTVSVVDSASGDTLTVSDIVIKTYGAATLNDRYIFTNEYSEYAGDGDHATNVVDVNGGSSDTVNASAVTAASVIWLNGRAGAVDGVSVRFTGIENAIGGDGSDFIGGTDAANYLIGMRGDDTLRGGEGVDTILGGAGDDELRQGDGTNEILNGGDGTDTGDWSFSISGSWVIDLEAGTARIGSTTYAQLVSIENALGGHAACYIAGSAVANELCGLEGGDTLVGRAGNDTLIGGLGRDVLTGGKGRDIFDFDSVADTGMTATTRDVIRDFTSQDLLDLSSLDANTATARNDAFDSITIGGAFSGRFATAGDLYFDTTINVLWGNTDGDAAAEFSIRIVGGTSMAFSNIVL